MGFLCILINYTTEFGAVFLAISPGAGQVGLGMGGVSYPHDIPGIYYNPANVSFVNKGLYVQNLPVATGYNSLFTEFGNSILNEIAGRYWRYDDVSCSPDWLPGLYPGMKYSYGGIKFPSWNMLHLGVNYTYLNTGETEANIDGEHYVWETYDYAVGATIGVSFFDDMISFGATGKYIYSFLAPEEVMDSVMGGDASCFTYDIGFLVRDHAGFSSFGISYSNIKGTVKYMEGGVPDPLPRVIRAGYSLSPTSLAGYLLNEFTEFPHCITDYFDCRFVREVLTDRVGSEHDLWHSYGLELIFYNHLYLREGHFEDRMGGRVGHTGGLGFKFANLKVDYADDSDIYAFNTSNSRISISLNLEENSNKYYAFPLSFMFPGAGHMYLGKQRGLLYSTAGTLFSILSVTRNEKRKNLCTNAFNGVLVISIVDLFLKNIID